MTTTDVADRALALADAARRGPDFETVRQVLNDVGIGRSRRILAEAPDLVANARLTLADAKEAEAQAKAAYLVTVSEAEFMLKGCFSLRGNKTYLTMDADGTLIDEEAQQPFLADQQQAWISDRAAKQPNVRTVQVALSGAERARARAADDLEVAEMKFSAAKHVLDSCAAELTYLGLALRSLPTYQES